MKALLIAVLAAAVGTPAYAQHAGHTMPMQAPAADPHAGHDMNAKPAPAPQPDPHAGHDTGTATPASPPAAADPHAGHDMGTMQPAAPAGPTDPHAGHGMGTMQPAAPASPADPHGGHGMGPEAGPAPVLPEAPPPPAAFSGPRHAADMLFDPSDMARAREDLRVEQGGATNYRVMVDQLEARIHDGRDGYLWDAQGWYGGDIDKLWIKTEGEGSFGEKTEEAEVQALWSRAITPWFDFQAGIRYDFRPDPERGHLVLGLQGLVPYEFEVDAAAFVSDEGDVSARFEAEYDLLITQRLILQPRAEVNLAAQEVRELGIGSGINDIELGLRLRYEFAREFAPYVGVEWERKLGETADFARDEGEGVDDLFFVTGVRIWF
ncbi:copper resistance protein B [Rhodoligotrophos defluvii]|uniref:copper resistance protein B n=1 Tax=Rhodoligotrophos defluvii TaxID=2561934 RepID=UPI0010C9EBA9|nr:copper resistance protein B [Rhodoligotrophos defluvii]